MNVKTLVEDKRGCGYRKPSKDGVGIYLMGDGIFEACERLPFPLTVCPCCGAGVKFTRGFTWIEPAKLFDPSLVPQCDPTLEGHLHHCCTICTPAFAGERAGLLWVGEQHYTPGSFMKEAQSRGISKKIAAIPHGFEVGTHYVYLAHNRAVLNYEKVACNGNGHKPEATPGVFMVFKPKRVDLVIEDEYEIPDRAKHLAEKLGDKARIVKVIRNGAQEVLAL